MSEHNRSIISGGVQAERPHELIDRIDRTPITSQWDGEERGFELFAGPRNPFGFVRFNIKGERAEMFIVYSYKHSPEDDPERRFRNAVSR